MRSGRHVNRAEIATIAKAQKQRRRFSMGPRVALVALIATALAITPVAVQALDTPSPAVGASAEVASSITVGAATVEPTPQPTESGAPIAPETPAEQPAPPEDDTFVTPEDKPAPPVEEVVGPPVDDDSSEILPGTEPESESDPSFSARAVVIGTHSISGTVTRDDGAPLSAGDQVWAVALDRDTNNEVSLPVDVALDGSYTLSDLPSYELIVQFGSRSGALVGEFYSDATSAFYAQPIDFTGEDAPDVTGIDAALATAGHISGTVTSTDSSSVDSVYVLANLRGDDGFFNFGYGADVASDGTYNIGGLRPGTYRVSFTTNGSALMGQYYDATYSESDATLVVITTTGQTISGIDAELSPGSTISGTVTRNDGGNFADGDVQVSLSPVTGNFSKSADVASDGTYTLEGVAPGEYKIWVYADAETNLITSYYGGSTWESAAIVTVVDGPAQDLGPFAVDLIEGSQISGTITRADGEPWAEGLLPQVSLETTDGYSGRSGTVNADGTYTIYAIPAGSFRVKFSGNFYDDTLGFVWYNNVIDPAAAQTFVFTSTPQSITGIDGQLAEASSVSGTVTRSDGQPLTEFATQIQLLTPDSNYVVAYAQPRADGTYTIENVTPADYIVRFNGSDFLKGEYYDNKQYAYEATVITVGSTPVTGIDAELVAGTTLTGTVTRSDGQPIGNGALAVYAYDADYRLASSAYVQNDGTYKLSALAPGAVKLEFVGQGSTSPYVRGWYGGGTSFSTATAITVPSDLTPVTGVNYTVPVGTTVSGTVTGPDGNPVSGAYVNLSSGAPDYRSASGTTNGSGEFIAYGVAAASYKVQFSSYGTGLLTEYYDNSRTQAGATPLVVGTTAVTGINAQLEQGSSITGTVSVPSGSSLANCAVTASLLPAVEVQTQSGGGGTCVEEDGTYLIDSIAPGDYKVAFGGAGLATQWYENTPVRADATIFSIVEGSPQTLTDVDADLAVGGSITGAATRSDGGTLNAVDVAVLQAGTTKVVSHRTVGTYQPTFTLQGLPVGDYIVRFTAPGLPTQYYGNSFTAAGATVVSVTEGALNPTGVNIALAAASPTVLTPTGGGGQTVSVGQSLTSLVVKVSDGSGVGVYGKQVTFTLTGPATFSNGTKTAKATSNSAGLAISPMITAGATPGTVTATAKLTSNVTVTTSFANSTVTAPSATLAANVTAVTSIVAGQAVLTVSATNNSGVPVTLVITTPFGGKTYTNVADGAEVIRVFKSYAPSIGAGSVTVKVTDSLGNSIDVIKSYGAVG